MIFISLVREHIIRFIYVCISKMFVLMYTIISLPPTQLRNYFW